jgi:hypothetical protein
VNLGYQLIGIRCDDREGTHPLAGGRAAPVFPQPADAERRAACPCGIRDVNGQALAYVYFEGEPGRRTAAKLLTKDEARRMGVNFAQVPGLPLAAT